METIIAGPDVMPPKHPYWCDDCGEKAAFTIPGFPVEHKRGCGRYNEDPMDVYRKAVEYCRTTGNSIP